MVVTPAKCCGAKGSLDPGNAEPVITSKEVQSAHTTLGFLCPPAIQDHYCLEICRLRNLSFSGLEAASSLLVSHSCT